MLLLVIFILLMGTTWRVWICVVVIFEKILRMLRGRRNNIDKLEFMFAIDEIIGKENMRKRSKSCLGFLAADKETKGKGYKSLLIMENKCDENFNINS